MKKLCALICLLTAPAFAQTNDDVVVRFTGFLGNLQLTSADVRADLMGADSNTRQIAVAMNEGATAAFAGFTKRHLNQTMTMFVCGEEVLNVTVQAQIDTGFALTGPLPTRRATAMANALNGLGECPN